MTIRSILRVIALTIVVCAFALVLNTCGGGRKGSVVQGLSPGSSQDSKTSPEGLDYPIEVSLDEALAELAAYPTPDGVDAELFAQLKAALGEALHEQWGASTSRSGVSCEFVGSPGLETDSPRGMGKFVSTPPTGEANRVDDLAIIDNGGGTYTLSWHYKNLGDYDQNGTVGISDITPLAMHYGETYEPTDVNCLLAVIDGSGNGTVDIADITPIAMNYAVDVASYSVRSSAHEWGAYTEIDAIGFEEATGGDVGRKILELPLVPELGTWYRVVPQDAAWNEGVVSEAVQYLGEIPPEVIYVSPLSGTVGSEATFSAVVTGATPMTYAWDFGGGAEPNTSDEESPRVTLGIAGEYSCSLNVLNAYGEDLYEFALTITSETTYVVSGTVSKADGGSLSGVLVSLDGVSSVATEPSGYFEFTGVIGGAHTLTPSLGNWTFTPPIRDVNVEYANVTGQDFTAYSPPVADLVADPASGEAPLLVDFDASASHDPDGGSIVKYEWDWEGDGTYDYDSGTDATVQHTYESGGLYTATVRVTDNEAAAATATTSTIVTVTGTAWVHTWGGNSDDRAKGVVSDDSGNVYVAGWTRSFGLGPASILLLKYDAAGNMLWSKTWGGTGDEVAKALFLDSAGNLYLAGATSSFGAGDSDVVLLKYDSNGNILWQRTWGGSGSEGADALIIDSLDNIYVAGMTRSFGTGEPDVALLKYDSNGNLLWQRVWDKGDIDYATSLAVDDDGNLYVCGNTYSFGAGEGDALVLKYDSSGNLVWDRTWGGSDNDFAYGAAIDESGNLLVTGNTRNVAEAAIAAFLLKYSPAGDLISEFTCSEGSNYQPGAITVDDSGRVYLAGASVDGSNVDVLFLEYAPAGGLTLAKTWGRNLDYEVAHSLFVDGNGTLYLAGESPTANGYWQEATPSVWSFSGSSMVPDGTTFFPFGTETQPTGAESSPLGIEDTGGGGKDVFVMKYVPE